MGNKYLDKIHKEIQNDNEAEVWQILNEHALKWFIFGFCCAIVFIGLLLPVIK